MRVCVLSAEEVGRLKFYGYAPCHKSHKHISDKQATKLVEQEKAEIVRGRDGVNHITMKRLYILKSKRSGPLRTIQRIVGTPMKHITPPSELDLSKE